MHAALQESQVGEVPGAASNAQERFDKLYISSAEIADELGVSRPAVLYARRRGMLPNAIIINDGQLYIWERAPVRPYIEAWKLTLASRRGELK